MLIAHTESKEEEKETLVVVINVIIDIVNVFIIFNIIFINEFLTQAQTREKKQKMNSVLLHFVVPFVVLVFGYVMNELTVRSNIAKHGTRRLRRLRWQISTVVQRSMS
jgi:uncharacterized membrane protein